MEIIDINGKKRRVKYIKMVKHIVSDDIIEKYVEVEIVGRNRNWVEWYPLSKFKKMNPGVEINEY